MKGVIISLSVTPIIQSHPVLAHQVYQRSCSTRDEHISLLKNTQNAALAALGADP